MRDFCLVVLFLTLLPWPLYAQEDYSVQGKVTDEDGYPLPGANIFLPEIQKGSVTGLKGEFIIRDLPAGRFILQISFVGYETHIASIRVGQEQQMLIVRLHPATIAADEVVISGDRHSTQHENAIKIELLKSNELKHIGSPTMIESLGELPGVDMISRGGISDHTCYPWTLNKQYPDAE
jgi:iron complex outermembrane receptor protein